MSNHNKILIKNLINSYIDILLYNLMIDFNKF